MEYPFNLYYICGMNSTKVQPENGKVKYLYDYPENRRVSQYLTAEDKQLISFKTGFSMNYVRNWCQGTRKNKRIEEWAMKIYRLNLAKLRKLNNQDKCSH